ncbi:MAG: hypothetical protein Q9170_001392 [Blastenia crenularia]
MDQLKAESKNITILTSDSEGYEASLRRWSGTAEKRAGAVAQVTTPEEVAAMIKFARKHHIEQVIRGGGQDTNGASSTEGGIVVDLSRMNRVTVDPENTTIVAEGGYLWKVIMKPRVITGLRLLALPHGLVIDNLLKVKMVTANSEIITASPGPIWALRGAGASFGAVVEFTYRAHQQREAVWAGLAAFTLGKLPAIVKFANDFALAANPDASFNFEFTNTTSRFWADVGHA